MEITQQKLHLTPSIDKLPQLPDIVGLNNHDQFLSE